MSKAQPAAKQRKNSGKHRANSTSFKPGNKYRFVSGFDPRRNYHGRPKEHDELRELIRDIGAEILTDKDGQILSTRVYDKIKRMFESRDPRDNSALLEHGWGKVKDEVEQSGELVIRIVREDRRDSVTEPASSAGTNQSGGEAV